MQLHLTTLVVSIMIAKSSILNKAKGEATLAIFYAPLSLSI